MRYAQDAPPAALRGVLHCLWTYDGSVFDAIERDSARPSTEAPAAHSLTSPHPTNGAPR